MAAHEGKIAQIADINVRQFARIDDEVSRSRHAEKEDLVRDHLIAG